MAVSSFVQLGIQKIIRETSDTHSLVLEPLNGTVYYQPGQFLTFIFPGLNAQEERRSYSLSSSPVLQEPMQITVKRITNGAWSRWLIDKAKEGDILQSIGANGYFVLPDHTNDLDRLIFFAAGSGIAPVFSLIKTALHTLPHLRLVLVYSTPSPEQTIFYEALLDLQHRFAGRLEIDFLFSNGSPRRRLNVSMIEAMANRYPARSLFYLCGPVEYMRTIAIVLKTAGIADNAIRREIFHVEKPPVKELPPDALPHTVTAEIDGNEYRFEVQYPFTILQMAKSLSIPIPYSCEAGQCGSCSATCISGRVWMWHNAVLLDDELAAGRVLTCTGYPVGGDVTLKF